MEKWKLVNLTHTHLKKMKYNVAVLPVGSIEIHAHHLPYGCDTFHVEKIAERVCEKATNLGAKVILLPTMPYGATEECIDFYLTMSLKQSTLNTFVTDIVRCLEHHKIYKLLILNGHGGNMFNPFMREFYRSTKVFMTSINWWYAAGDIGKTLWENKGGHANEMETSVAMELTSELVHMEFAGDGKYNKTRFKGMEDGWAGAIYPWDRFTKSGGHGDPRKATREKGKKFLKVTVERIAGFIKELSDAPLSRKLPF